MKRQEKVQQWTGYDQDGNEYHNGFGRTKASGTKSLKLRYPQVQFIHIEKYSPFIEDPDNGLGMSEAEVLHLESLQGANYV